MPRRPNGRGYYRTSPYASAVTICGGTLALKCFNEDSPTRERLQYPQLRVNGELTQVDWDTALDVMAAVSKHVLAKHGEAAWAMKTLSYEFFENTFAITKLAFGAIKTPAFSQHDKPAMGADTAGLDDSGLILQLQLRRLAGVRRRHRVGQ